jgi:hypothetical protein
VLASLDQEVVQEAADRLGGVAASVVLGGEGEADLGLAWVVGGDVGRAVADQPIGGPEGDGELEPLAGRVGVDGRQLLQELAGLTGRVGRLPALVAGDLGIGP